MSRSVLAAGRVYRSVISLLIGAGVGFLADWLASRIVHERMGHASMVVRNYRHIGVERTDDGGFVIMAARKPQRILPSADSRAGQGRTMAGRVRVCWLPSVPGSGRGRLDGLVSGPHMPRADIFMNLPVAIMAVLFISFLTTFLVMNLRYSIVSDISSTDPESSDEPDILPGNPLTQTTRQPRPAERAIRLLHSWAHHFRLCSFCSASAGSNAWRSRTFYRDKYWPLAEQKEPALRKSQRDIMQKGLQKCSAMRSGSDVEVVYGEAHQHLAALDTGAPETRCG